MTCLSPASERVLVVHGGKKNKGNKSVETRKIKMNFERKLNVEAQRTEAEEVGSGDDE